MLSAYGADPVRTSARFAGSLLARRQVTKAALARGRGFCSWSGGETVHAHCWRCRRRRADARSPRSCGLLLAGYGIGGAAGSLVVSSLKLPRRYRTLMIAFWGGGTLPLVLVGVAESLPLALAALFVVGATTGAGVVIWGTPLQRLVPPEMIGRVASLDFFVSIAFMPISIAVAGPLSLLVPIPAIFVVAGSIPPVLAVAALLAGRMRSYEARHPLDS